MKPPKKIIESLKKTVLAGLLSMFLILSSVQPVMAQILPTTSPDVLGFEGAMIVREESQKNIGNALVGALTALLINGLNYVATLTAQSTAQWVADGGAGKHPLFNRQTINEIGDSVEAYVTSEFIDEIAPGSKVLASLGIDPENPDATSYLRRALSNPYVNQPERLDGTTIAQGFNGYIASVASLPGDSADRQAKVITDTINAVNVNEFYGLMQAYGQTRARAGETAALEQFKNTINAGFQDLTDPISGAVKWPAQQVRQQLNDAIAAKKQNDTDTGKGLIAAAGENALIQVGVNFVTTFASTLFGSLTQKLFDGLLSDIDYVTFNPFDPNQVTTGNNDNLFESIGIFETLDPSNFNLVQELASCPATLVRNSRGIFSCAIDSSFLSAVAQGNSGAPLTLQQAIEEGFVNENWTLFGPSASENRDASCYQRAFCYTNLQKLRKARIVPIGWELAAELSGNGQLTLKEVMDGFYDCNIDGQRDEEHPYCNLINPKWIIKAPESQCRTLAYGQQLESAGVENRAEECVDVQTCVAEDENGNCIGQFGYCVAEENVWRFRGDSCDPQFASCQTLVNDDGRQVSYNLNTVDFANCGPDSSGCTWYATEKTANEEGNFDWPKVNDVATFTETADASNEITYFKDTVETCSATDAGCTNLRSRVNGLSFNMVQNPGFENDADSNDLPDYWAIDQDASTTASPLGGLAANLATGSFRQYGFTLEPTLDYTLSFYADRTAGPVAVNLEFILMVDGEPRTISSVFGTGTRVTPIGSASCGVNGQTLTILANSTGRVGCVFNLPSVADAEADYVADMFFGGLGLVDDVMLEQTSNASTFVEGYTTSVAAESIQLPPDYLNCRGAEDDPEECAGYAQICSAADAGCQLYTPATGGPSVSAIVGQNDFCPGVCVGYDAYKQEATKYEPDGIFPIHFIPRTAETCSVEAAGCSEFTNLETEEIEYFSDLRACNTPEQAGNNAQTFYTWQGSEDAGFQLRAWNLLESNVVEDAPCINFEASANGNTCIDPAPAVIASNEACNTREDIFTNPDCREFFNAEGEIFYREWSKTVSINNQCTTYRKTSVVGNNAAERAAVCASSGGYSDSSGSCLYFGLASESEICSASENGCRLYTGGRSNNSLTLLEENFEFGLASWAGNPAGQISLSTESLSEGGQSLLVESAATWVYFGDVGAAASSGAIAAPQENLEGENCTVSAGNQYCGALANQLVPGTTYTLSFWARGTGSLDVGFGEFANGDLGGPAASFANDISLNTEWRRYEFGPLNIDQANFPDFGAQNSLFFDATGTSFVDNITLVAGEQNLALIQNSWVTPAACDTNIQGQFSPQFHLGCQAYTNAAGGTNFLKSFSRLCSEDQVGCTGYFDGQASESTYGLTAQGICNRLNADTTSRVNCHLEQNPGGATFNTSSPRLCTIAPGQTSCTFTYDQYIEPQSSALLTHIELNSDTERVETDQPVYAIVEESDYCNSENLGCTELGLPTLSADQSTVENWNSVYLVNAPDTYGETLCQEDELFCSEFNTPNQQSVYYFRDPGQKTCEYKEAVRINGQAYSGWFVKGTSDFCYGTGSCRDSGESCTTDSNCRQADVGSCSVSGNACSQDSDCSTNESCVGVSDDICQIDNGSYLIGGIESGIRLNGDATYSGWVAECPPGQSGCRGFEDPLDSAEEDGYYGSGQSEAYYYIDNANIGDRGLSRTQACNGEYSAEEGCVLFNDTAIPEQTFSSAASTVASRHADTLRLGDRPFDLVQPIDCTEGNSIITYTNDQGQRVSVDLCAQRCQYNNYQLKDSGEFCVEFNEDGTCAISEDFSDANTLVESIFAVDAGGNLLADDLNTVYTYTGSCFVNSDCAPLRSDAGNMVEGTCTSTSISSLDAGGDVAGELPVPRLENDSNRVLKVNRDRTCSEWVALDDCRVIWDENLGQFKNSCASLQLCSEVDPTGARSCKVPIIDDPAMVLDIENYTNRDASWYGKEYSGYAIPNQFLPHQLSQEDISPAGVCYLNDEPVYENGILKACNPEAAGGGSNTGCNVLAGETCAAVLAEDTTYTIAYNAGACEQTQSGYGDSCTVGYCTGDGNPCSNDNQCLNGQCTVGQCVLQGDTCEVDSDCGRLAKCNAGICETPTGDYCEMDGACGVGVCNISDLTQAGTCFSGNCLVGVDGRPLKTIDTELKACRAHPESDSPFSNVVVEAWNALVDEDGNGKFDLINSNQSASFDTKNTVEAIPYDVKAGFERVNTCAPGEICECSYKKISSASGANYIELTSTTDDILRQILNFEEGESVRRYDLGICSGGTVDGAFCAIDDQQREYGCQGQVYDPNNPEESAAGIGTCNPVQREDSLLGLKGFCLERDTGVNVNGDPSEGACLTWYPVDELAGETDLYAKFKSAGYFEESYQCLELGLNRVYPPFLGCASERGRPSFEDDDDQSRIIANQNGACAYMAHCPDGFYAIAGNAAGGSNNNPDTQYTEMCADSDQVIGGRAACPYICVAENAVDEDGNICEPPSTGRNSNFIERKATFTSDIGSVERNTVYYTSDTTTFAQEVENYSSCLGYGFDPEGNDTGLKNLVIGRPTQSGDEFHLRGDANQNKSHSNIDIINYPAPATTGNEQGGADYELKSFIDIDGSEIAFGDVDSYPVCDILVKTSSGNDPKDLVAPKTNYIYGFELDELGSRTGNLIIGQDDNGQVFNSVSKTRRFFKSPLEPFGQTSAPFSYPFAASVAFPVPQCYHNFVYYDGTIGGGGAGDFGGGGKEVRIYSSANLNSDGTLSCVEMQPNDVINAIGANTVNNIQYKKLELMKWGSQPVLGMNWVYFTNYQQGINEELKIGYSDDDGIGGVITAEDERRGVGALISNLFARSGSVEGDSEDESAYVWDHQTKEYEAAPLISSAWDSRDEGNPPTIYSVNFNSTNCVGGLCPEGPANTLTLNGRNSGDFVAADGYFQATLEFFVAADANQLPLRRIVVDWSNEDNDRRYVGSDAVDNYYKNHRGVDSDGNVICQANDEWGKTAQSCEAATMRYTKTFICNQKVWQGLDSCEDNPGEYPCADGSIDTEAYCVYQPAVHARDQWGWCTGTCTGGDDGTDGCFTALELDSTVTQVKNECNYEIFPARDDANDPWVRYDGEIRVRAR